MNRKQDRSSGSATELPPGDAGSGVAGREFAGSGWSRPWRWVASIWLSYHIAAMFLSPLSVPPTSLLVVQLQGYVAHYQTLLYLNHGYRFFAPDPGPASLIEYRIVDREGREISGWFPDRQAINRDYPRLLYHRWFMWSETLGRLYGDWISPEQFRQYEVMEQGRAAALRAAGQVEEADRLAAQLREDRRLYEAEAAERRELLTLLTPTARLLLERHRGQEVQLRLNRRMIPSIEEARQGMKPNDPRLLDPRRAIALGRWSWRAEDGQAVPVSPEEEEAEPRGQGDWVEVEPGSGDATLPTPGGNPR